jgi:LysR family cyn operon transcriptional activator
MELRHLRYFLAVADGLHFGRAAKRLHISQPTVSQQIHELEGELDAKLFERRGRGVRLTPAGELFRTYASRALEDVAAGARAIDALERNEVGELRIAYFPSMSAGVVAPAIAAVLRKHPGVRVTAYEGVSRRVERLVLEGKADVGLGLLPVRSTGLETEALIEGRLALVVPSQHRLAGAANVTLRDLEDVPFAMLSRSLRARALADALFARARFSPRVVLEADTVALVLSTVRAGLAVTVLPEPRVASADRLVIVSLRPAPAPHVAALFFRRDAPRSPLAQAFAAEARAISEASRSRRPSA